MIVRIATEGQYEVPESAHADLTRLDHEAVTACEAGSEDAFHQAYQRLLTLIREQGQPVSDDHLGGSDIILPPPDVTLEEAVAEFHGEGLIPG